MTTKTARTGFKVGDLIAYPGFPEDHYEVTRRRWQHTLYLYDLVDSHHCTINRVSLTGCKKVGHRQDVLDRLDDLNCRYEMLVGR